MITDFCVPPVLSKDTEKLKKGVVKLSVLGPDGKVETGAGIIVGADSVYIYILTALHVVVPDLDSALQNIKVKVEFHDFQGKTASGRLFPHFDEDLDLAIVYVKLARPGPVAFESLSPL